MDVKAFLFDLDGVLTDTAHYHFLAWQQLAVREDLAFNEMVNEHLKGVSRMESLEIILRHNSAEAHYSPAQKLEMTTWKNNRYRELLQNITPADILPGVAAFLQDAQAAGLRLAVASASRNAFTVLGLLGLADSFDYVADASKITEPKPHPEVFLNCAAALGLAPSLCVGVEDAYAGIEAITRAGMRSVGINVAEGEIYRPGISLASTDELNFAQLLPLLQALPCPPAD